MIYFVAANNFLYGIAVLVSIFSCAFTSAADDFAVTEMRIFIVSEMVLYSCSA